MVVVGDLIGSGASQQQSIVGETPNLAARLQAIANERRAASLGKDARHGTGRSTANCVSGSQEPTC